MTAARDCFAGYHPAVNFLYFALVLGFTVCLSHPAYLAVSLLAAFAYSAALSPRRALRFALRCVLPLMLFAALLNPAFNHAGVTILTYLPSGNPLTLESLLCGLSSAVLLAAALVWFSCCTAVLTSDKFLYLFGKAAPALALLLSMTLRFVPRLRAQLGAIGEARRGLGRGGGRGLLPRAREGAAQLSVLVTWALENAVETGDSMRSRGYGLPGRTSYSVYRWSRRDRAAMAWLCFCGLFLLAGALAGALRWRWFPSLRGPVSAPMTWGFLSVWTALCFTPVILDRREARRWKRSRSAA